MRAVIALVVIVLVTGVFGMSQVMSKTELLKMRLVNQMVDIELLRERIKDNEGYDLIPKYLEYDDANGKHIIETWLTGGHGTKLSKNHKEPEGGYTEAYFFNEYLRLSYLIYQLYSLFEQPNLSLTSLQTLTSIVVLLYWVKRF